MDIYVLIDEHKDTIFCLGVSKDYEKMIGKMYLTADEWRGNYGEDYSVKTSDLYELEGESGVGITITAESKTGSSETFEHHLYVLTHYEPVKKDQYAF